MPAIVTRRDHSCATGLNGPERAIAPIYRRFGLCVRLGGQLDDENIYRLEEGGAIRSNAAIIGTSVPFGGP